MYGFDRFFLNNRVWNLLWIIFYHLLSSCLHWRLFFPKVYGWCFWWCWRWRSPWVTALVCSFVWLSVSMLFFRKMSTYICFLRLKIIIIVAYMIRFEVGYKGLCGFIYQSHCASSCVGSEFLLQILLLDRLVNIRDDLGQACKPSFKGLNTRQVGWDITHLRSSYNNILFFHLDIVEF